MSKLKYWLLATRPKTLAASIVPVLIGSSIAFSDKSINYPIVLITMLCAVLIQVITNYINEIYDFKKGADTKDRIGPQRMVASGIISPQQMTIAVIILLTITFLFGLILVIHSDISILIIGLISLLLAWFYTGGPFPLAYKGLGDIFVFIFFGIIAVSGSYYVQTQSLNSIVFIAALSPGFLSMNILGINNFRDIDTDKMVGKITLSVRIGKNNSILLYTLLMILSFIVPILLVFATNNYFSLLPLITLPLAIKLVRDMKTKKGMELNSTLAGTGKLLFFHGILMSLSFIINHLIK